MTKRRIIRNTNKSLNLYAEGGQSWGKLSSTKLSNAFKGDNLGGTLGTIGGAASTMLGSALSSAQLADTSGLEADIKNKQTYKVGANNNQSLMDEWSAYSPMNNVSWRDIRGQNGAQGVVGALGSAGAGFAAGATIGGPIGGIIGGVVGLGSSLIGTLSGNAAAKKKARNFNNQINTANARNLVGLQDKASYIDTQNDLNLMSNYYKSGGYLYENGGNLNTLIPNKGQHGGDFSNGVTIINNGDTHENNPNQGVMIGVDPNGVPNLVEEGEVIYNNYVFSNRLSPNKKDLIKLNLPEVMTSYSFAKLAEKESKESEERPNDPISKNGLRASLDKLQILQETQKMKKNKTSRNNMFAKGGDLVNEFTNPLYKMQQFEAKVKANSNTPQINKDIPTKSSNLDKLLRYSPIIGSGLATLSDMAGLTNKPDYSNAERIERAANSISKSSPNQISDYLTYTPLDRNYMLNKLEASAGAARRAIENTSGGNRATATAGILAADYNTQSQMGDLFRNAAEYNQNLKAKVKDFNRQTNMFNIESGLKADSLNAQIDGMKLKSIMQSAGMREQIDVLSSQSRSANLNTFLENLGSLGQEKSLINIINSNPALKYMLDENYKTKYKTGKNGK